MHELGLCEGLVEAVERRAAGRRVARVRVRIGALHQVVPSALDQAFELVAGGTTAEGAAVDLVVTPVRVGCRACGHHTDAAELPAACTACGGVDLHVTGGDELLLESIELSKGGADVPWDTG
jgi:hydrogenase nickel incorporation protein HypA/HybF